MLAFAAPAAAQQREAGITFQPGESATLGTDGGALDIADPIIVGDTQTLTLLGSNNLTGGITLSGHLIFGSSGTVLGPTSTITTTGSVITYADGSDNAAPIVLASDDTQLEVLNGDVATQSGQISETGGSRPIEKIGDGTLILTADNSYSGGTTLTAGTIVTTSQTALGFGGLTQTGGELDIRSPGLTLGALAGTGGTITTNDAFDVILTVAGGTTTYAGVLTDGASALGLDVTNGADLTLTGDNSFTFGLAVIDGSVELGSDTAAGGAFNTIYTLGDLATIRFADRVVNESAIELGALNTNLFVDAGASAEQFGDIFECGCSGFGITKTGAGTLTLSGFNFYTGTTSILGGTLAVTEFGLGVSQLVEVGNGAQLQALEDIFVGDMAILAGGGTIDTGANFVDVIGSIDLQHELTKIGSGILIIEDIFEEGTGAGGINVLAGTLGLGSDFAAGTGTIRLADGTTLLNAACDCVGLELDNDIQVAIGGTVTIDGGGLETILNGALTGGNIDFISSPSFSEPTASVFVLNGLNSYGDTLIGPNVALILADGTLGAGNVTFDSTLSDPFTPSALVFANNADYTYGGSISGAGGVFVVPTDPDVTVTLTGSNTAQANFTGFVFVGGNLVLNGNLGDVVNNSAYMLLGDQCGCSASLGGSGTFHGTVDASFGGSINPGNSPGTLTISSDLLLGSAATLNYELGEAGVVGGSNNDLIVVGGNLLLDGTLNVAAWGPNYGPGYYRLINYDGSLTDNGLDLGSIAGGFSASVLTNIDGQVNLLLGNGTAQIVQYWDGTDLGGTMAEITGRGGAGTWNGSNTNWTVPTDYAINDVWQSQVGVFAGAAGGTVTVEGVQAFQELRFETDEYLLQPTDSSARLATTGGFSIIDVSGGVTADIGVVIEGTGGLTKVGAGTLTLSGPNSYSGGTTLASGTLRLMHDSAAGTGTITTTGSVLSYGDGITVANPIALASNTTRVEVLLGEAATQAGVIFEAGGIRPLEKIGGGTLTLTAVNTYTGLTTVSGGTLVVASGGSLAGAVQNNASFTNSGTVAGLVTNDGTLVSTGVLNSGLVNRNSASLSGQVNGAVDNSGAILLTGSTTGIGAYTGQSGSSFDLAGLNTSIGSLAGDGTIVLGGATLSTGSNNLSTRFDGSFEGMGGLTKVGTGTLELSGNAGYFGPTSVAGGVLRTLNSLLFTGGTDVDVAAGATFDVNGTVQQIDALSGGGTVLLGNGLLIAGAIGGTSTFSGSLFGTGEFRKIGSGLLTLTGASTIGTLSIATGGVLQVGATGNVTASLVDVRGSLDSSGTLASAVSVRASGSLTSTGIIDGSLTNRGGVSLAGQLNGPVENFGTITLTGTTTGIGFYAGQAGSILALSGFDTTLGSLAGEGSVQLGSATLTIGGNNISTSFTGTISGSGSLAKTGAGTLTLTGLNTYSGGTVLDQGTIAVGGDSVIGSGMLAMANGTTLAAAANATLANAVQLGSTGSVIDSGGFALTLNGIVSGGALTKIGAGTLTLNGVNTYTGLTTVSAGTLAVGSTGAIAGNVGNLADFTNAGIVAGLLANQGTASNSGTIDGGVVNDGTLTSTGIINVGIMNRGTVLVQGQVGGTIQNLAGTITLTGATSPIAAFAQAPGATLDLAGFDLSVGTLSGAGGINLGAGALTVGGSNSNPLFGGTITGAGSLVKTGSGILALTGSNTYAGGTTISAGTLQLGSGGGAGSIQGPVLNNGVLAVNRSDAVTFAGAISGTGMVVQAGAGTTTLTGANSYSGGTLISAGRLVGDTGSLQGDIQNDAALEFAQGVDGTFSGRLFGAGLLDKTGTGRLTLTANNSNLTGETQILGGELRVDGLLSRSRVIVGGGTTLSGTGVVGGFTAQSGATVAPGSGGIGMLGVNGDLQFAAGSTYAAQLQASSGDLILANGTAQLGGNIAVANLGGVYLFNSTYLLLQADGGRTGTFAATSLTGFAQAFRPEIVYTGTQVLIRMAPNQLSAIAGSTALTFNQASTLQRIDAAVAAGFNPQGLMALFLLPAAQIGIGFDALSGEAYATTTRALLEDRLVREAALGRLVALQRHGDGRAGWGAWGQGFRSWGDGDGDGNAAGFDRDQEGLTFGIDYSAALEDGSLQIGIQGHYDTIGIAADARGSRAEVERAGGGLYAGAVFGNFAVRAGATYSLLDGDVRRQVTFTGFDQSASGDLDGEMIQAFGELAYTLPLSSRVVVEPFVNVALTQVDFDPVVETGGVAALNVRGHSHDLGLATFGLRGRARLGGEGAKLSLDGSVGLRTSFGDRVVEPVIALAAAPAQAFAIRSAAVDDVALAAELAARLDLSDRFSLTIGYSGVIGDRARDHAARAGISLRF